MAIAQGLSGRKKIMPTAEAAAAEPMSTWVRRVGMTKTARPTIMPIVAKPKP